MSRMQSNSIKIHLANNREYNPRKISFFQQTVQDIEKQKYVKMTVSSFTSSMFTHDSRIQQQQAAVSESHSTLYSQFGGSIL